MINYIVNPESLGLDSLTAMQTQVLSRFYGAINNQLVVSPTGSGKSVLFQYIGKHTSGFTVVIMPLVSLINEQVQRARYLNIEAVAIHSQLTLTEKRLTSRSLNSPLRGLVFVTPEVMIRQDFQQLLLSQLDNMECAFIDEAHCILQWGASFRPSYLTCVSWLNEHPSVPVIMATATLNHHDVAAITHLFDNRKFELFHDIAVPNNIDIIPVNVGSEFERLETCVALMGNVKSRAILYAATRTQCKQYQSRLTNLGIGTVVYHAGMSSQAKQQAYTDFLHCKVRILIATSAFGMGIDIPDIETVIHLGFPPALEDYIQHIGRAGRNESPAKAYLLEYKAADKHTRETLQRAPLLNIQIVPKLFNFLQAMLAQNESQLSYSIKSLAQLIGIDASERHMRNAIDTLVAHNIIEAHFDGVVVSLSLLGDSFSNLNRLRLPTEEQLSQRYQGVDDFLAFKHDCHHCYFAEYLTGHAGFCTHKQSHNPKFELPPKVLTKTMNSDIHVAIKDVAKKHNIPAFAVMPPQMIHRLKAEDFESPQRLNAICKTRFTDKHQVFVSLKEALGIHQPTQQSQ